MKQIFLYVLLVLFTTVFASRCAPKFTLKFNDIDSAVRIVNSDHNCNCDYGDKSVSLYTSNNGKRNLYYWQAVYLKSVDGINFLSQARKTREHLIKLAPELGGYRRFYVEFRLNQTTATDTAFKWKNIGTAFFIKDKCNGYKAGANAKELIKQSHNKKFEAALCK